MNVGSLQQHLLDLAKLLEANKASGAAKDLQALSAALAPFTAQSPADFTRFLAQAHEYHTTGKLSASAKAARAPRAAKAKADPSEVASSVRQLYDRAGDLSLTMEQIEAELAKLAGLTKPGLVTVCDAMELAGMKGKNVPEIRAAIRQKILDRRSGAQRAAMIERPTEAPVGALDG